MTTPTEPGWYWTKPRADSKWTPVWWDQPPYLMNAWGPRIYAPDETPPAAEPIAAEEAFDVATGVWYDAACSEDYGRTSRLIGEAEAASRDVRRALAALREQLATVTEQHEKPLPMLLWCPQCGARHIDVDAFAHKPHHTHACQTCGMTWRPAVHATVGVQFLPGFKNESKANLLADRTAADCCK